MTLGLEASWPWEGLYAHGEPIRKAEITLASATLILGCTLGPVFCWKPMEVFGTKHTILFFSIFDLFSWILTIAYASAGGVYISKFFSGVWTSIVLTVLPLYLAETVSSKHRGAVISLYHPFFLLGSVFTLFLARFLELRTTSLVALSVPCLAFLGIFLAPESPYYYMWRGNKEAARRSLVWLAKTKDPERDLERIEEALNAERARIVGGNSWHSFGGIFTRRKVAKTFAVVVLLRVFGQYCQLLFGTDSSFHWIPEDYVHGWLFRLLVYLAWAVSGLLGAFLTDSWGRRPTLITSSTLTFLSGLGMSIVSYLEYNARLFDSSWPLAAWASFDSCLLEMGLIPVPLIFLAELFPIGLRPRASALISFIVSLLSGVPLTLLIVFSDKPSRFIIYSVGTVFALLAVLISAFFANETKRKTLGEIQNSIQMR